MVLNAICAAMAHTSGEGRCIGGRKGSRNSVLELLFLGRCIGEHCLQGNLWSLPHLDTSLMRKLQPWSRWRWVHAAGPRRAGRKHPCLIGHSTLTSLLQLEGKTSTSTSHGPRNMISPCPSEGIWLLFQRMTWTDVALCEIDGAELTPPHPCKCLMPLD